MEKLDASMKEILSKIANTVRGLSMDAVQKANSGHPGLPMGCAELGAYLYGFFLRHNPKNPKWLNRDRLVLSAGHGSMWLYSLLHLSGFNLSLEEIKNFRQLHSKTPGHPEYGHTEGVEATTGPLGQGVGNAVGMALGLKILAQKFNQNDQALFDSKVICLASDGDIMEGVASEASSIAGHLKLDNLIVLFDANHVTLDGPLSESCSEDTLTRYRSYGWDVYELDGYDFDAMHALLPRIREEQKRPAFILMHTIIGRGSPNKAGTFKVHGAPLGEEEVAAAKASLGWPQEPFYIPQVVKDFFDERLSVSRKQEDEWQELFRLWAKSHPELAKTFETMVHKPLGNLEEKLWAIEIKPQVAGRAASQSVIQLLAEELPFLYGGSADLSTSDLTTIKGAPLISPCNFRGRNIKFGVREFGMATIASGLALTQMLTPFIGTFLTFSDYMRNAIRLAALSNLQVIYQFTHESVFLGEDGPTHQPIEHYMALRAIPHLQVIRPADSNEVRMAWLAALQYKGPTAILLTRQPLRDLKETNVPYREGMGRGGYIVKQEKQKPDYTLFATGSELALAIDLAHELEKRGRDVHVISMPCFEIFDRQDPIYIRQVIGGDLGRRVSIEAGVELGWHKYIGMEGIAIGMESYGASAPARVLQDYFGFQVDQILERIL